MVTLPAPDDKMSRIELLRATHRARQVKNVLTGSKHIGEDSRASLSQLLEAHFGHKEFRPHQEDIIRVMLQGKDVLATLPTGHGKSLCYQLPALLTAKSTTLVISPLIALMRDQTRALNERGLRAAYLESGQSEAERDAELKRVQDGKVSLLYISPERLRSDKFMSALKRVVISRIVVDEAHCVSLWGHDFRASYLCIADARRSLGNPPIAAFTATAPVVVREDIRSILKLKDPFELHADVDRPNIDFKVEYFGSLKEKVTYLMPILARSAKLGAATIVYCARITTVEQLSAIAKESNIPHCIYHGSLSRSDRIRIENEFLSGSTPIIIATNAFGMGIDKPDVRAVYHVELPDSLESYYQEVGRAGRDGQAAQGVLLFQSHDFLLQRQRLQMSNPSIEYIDYVCARLVALLPHGSDAGNYPIGKFYHDRFIRWIAGDNQVIARKAEAALAALEEHGIFSFQGVNFRPLHPVETLRKGKSLIDPIVIAEKGEADIQRLKVLVYYTQKKPADLRSTILSHFRHNSIVSVVPPGIMEEFAPSQDHIVGFLNPLAKEDRERGYFSRMLGGRDNNKKDKSESGALEGLTSREIRIEEDYIADLGLLRYLPIGNSTYVSITKAGLDYLKRLGIELPVIESYADIKKRMYSASVGDHLRTALQDWFTIAQANVKTPVEWWNQIQTFLSTTFDILGSKKTGQELTLDYFRLPSKGKNFRSANLTQGKQLLNYVFGDVIVTPAISARSRTERNFSKY